MTKTGIENRIGEYVAEIAALVETQRLMVELEEGVKQ